VRFLSLFIQALYTWFSLLTIDTSATALCDYFNRRVVALVRQWRIDVADSSGNYHGPKGGDFNIYKPKQQVLDRSSCVIEGIPDGDPYVEIRFTVTLPAFGRSINGDKVRELLINHLPKLVQNGLLWKSQDHAKVYEHLRSVEVQQALRDNLSKMNLVAFIGNESILPRASGVDPGPMKTGAIGFRSPASLSISIDTGIQDSTGENIVITGMGIPRGITVITGGGFHGKSTLLEAIQLGIYNVIPGDGRERVVADPYAFMVRAEDGRSVVNTDISPFISALPGGKTTSSFTTADASGSTSMAANIQEALEIGATTLIIDEDTSATNFLVRDSKMHELVISEPITPLVSKVTAMFKDKDVSTIIVVGGCGDYLYPATTVIGMESYVPYDWTLRAHEIASRYPNAAPEQPFYGHIPSRVLSLPKLGEKGPRVLGMGRIRFQGDRRKADVAEDRENEVDLSALEQFVEEAQANLCADVLEHIQRSGSKTVKEWAVEFDRLMAQRGTNISGGSRPRGNLAWTRPLELLAVANRVRGLTVTQKVRS
jgi:predicted ABC-class ATPase